ncbi:MAG TPA: hypothetical protein VGM31_05395 [Puia sp.]
MRPQLKKWLTILSIPVGYALILRYIFGLSIIRDYASVMTISFLVGVPFGVGYLTILLSPIDSVRKPSYRWLAPMVPIFVFFLVTVALAIEGLVCWIMILPIFLILSLLGGSLAAHHKIRKADKKSKLKLSLVLCLPFMMSVLEVHLPDPPTRYEAYAFIDIHAPADTIWNNVIRVRTISPQQDHSVVTNWLGFPRPIRAELNYAGVGGSRQAIPSTTMDEHIVVGGDYFDVLDGTYELAPLNNGSYRLHLYSHFVLKTHFNFYASWWAGWIMKDTQNNILHVIQTRCRG